MKKYIKDIKSDIMMPVARFLVFLFVALSWLFATALVVFFLSNLGFFISGLLFSRECKADSFYNVEVLSVYDGDTFKVNLPCEQPMFCNNVSIRILGIDAPEMKGKCRKEKDKALAANIFVENFLYTNVNLLDCKLDKYGGRIDCDVVCDGEDLGTALIKAGLAVDYHGGKKVKEWCK